MKLELRLSEAILAGSVLVPEMKEGDINACALGMAADAVGIPRVTAGGLFLRYLTIGEKWPWIETAGEDCPQCGVRHWRYEVIFHVFDQHVIYDRSMTLEQLCDYVRSIEPAEPTISILPSRQPLVRIPEGSDQGDEQPEWDDTDTSRELYSGIQRGCQ